MPCKGYKWDEARHKAFRESGEIEAKSKRFKGIPKSEEQKKKMSEAKLGVAKSDEHRASMVLAHKARWDKYRSVKEMYPEMERKDIWALIKKNPDMFSDS